MFCKIRYILWLSALVLAMGGFHAENAMAQGVVTLAENSSLANENSLNKDIPDELSLFDEGNAFVTVQDEAPVPAENPPSPKPDLVQVSAPQENVPAEKEVSVSETDFNPIMPASLLAQPGAGIGVLGSNAIPQTPEVIDDTVFSQMSDLEKQTALLNLQLRRERVKNEIEAIKNQRKAALEQEKEKEEAKKKQKIEWEKAQEQKVVQEQQKLREMDISFEKIRQEKLLNAYKNKMLAENQKWVKHNGDLYDQMTQLKKEKQDIFVLSNTRLATLKGAILAANTQAMETKAAFQREVADLQSQISVLKSRIDAQEKEIEKRNPFAEGSEKTDEDKKETVEVVEPELKLNNMYAVMEIRGQSGELIAKLINQDGEPFYVKKGTMLQSGHIIDEVTSTYVRAEKNGVKDYLYFAAGGILPLEPVTSEVTTSLKEVLKKASTQKKKEPTREFVTSADVPGMGRDMIVR